MTRLSPDTKSDRLLAAASHNSAKWLLLMTLAGQGLPWFYRYQPVHSTSNVPRIWPLEALK